MLTGDHNPNTKENDFANRVVSNCAGTKEQHNSKVAGSRFQVPLVRYWRSLANFPLSANISSVFHVVIALGVVVSATNLTKSLKTFLAKDALFFLRMSSFS